MDIEKITTADGSSSLYRNDIDETYHSRHGAVQEALHVFIEMGLKKVAQAKKEITILEVGFGTGLNCLLSSLEAEKLGVNINYLALETIPLQNDLIEGLTYTNLNPAVYRDLHNSKWEITEEINANLQLTKLNSRIQDFSVPAQSVDLIYYDAFGPRAQPEMWVPTIFEKLYNFLAPRGVFVTYCAKGQVRRDLQNTGLEMERLPGPPGKREMLRGSK